MKTAIRLLLIPFAAVVCSNAYAQNSVSDLFNTYVIVPAQQRIQILTDELNNVNAQIQDLQDQLANSTATATADQGGDPDIVNPPSPLVAQIAEQQLRATELQNTLTYWQTQLAAWLLFNTQQQEQYLLANQNQIMPDLGEDEFNAALSNANRFGPMPNPSNPWILPVFVSTGDAQQDAQLVQQWLFQHGLIDLTDGQ